MLKLILITIVSLFIIGCDNSTHAYTTGKSLPYCVVEDKQPRIVCINGYLLKENPLFGVQQGQEAYRSIQAGSNSFDGRARCYCNPELEKQQEKNQ